VPRAKVEHRAGREADNEAGDADVERLGVLDRHRKRGTEGGAEVVALDVQVVVAAWGCRMPQVKVDHGVHRVGVRYGVGVRIEHHVLVRVLLEQVERQHPRRDAGRDREGGVRPAQGDEGLTPEDVDVVHADLRVHDTLDLTIAQHLVVGVVGLWRWRKDQLYRHQRAPIALTRRRRSPMAHGTCDT